MPTKTPIKHGTRAGYDAELVLGNVCDRCRKAKAVYQRQYTKAGKAKGLKYGSHNVIDHLYDTARQSTARGITSHGRQAPDRQAAESPEPATDTAGQDTEAPATRGIADRLSSALGSFTLRAEKPEDYVSDSGMPDYLHTVDPDPEPADPNVSPVMDEQFIITRGDMVLIEENLGTYLSVIGMTLEMVDPYCGPILADNLDNIVQRWSKVIARYPAAAKLFMAKGGGVLMDWIGAIQATWPVLFAVYEHHLSKNVVTEKGRVFRVQANPNGQTVDATMPPMPEYDYSAT